MLVAVWPDRNHPELSLLVEADASQAGADAIQAAYPDLMLACNKHELMVSIQRFRAATHLYHWSAMQRHGTQFLIIVIEDGKPVGLCNVRAKKFAQALSVASKNYPGAKFQPLGHMAQYVSMAARIANVLEGRGQIDFDFRLAA